MKKSIALITGVAWVLLAALAWADALPTATPEEVGLSSQRLARVTEVVKSEIAQGRFSQMLLNGGQLDGVRLLGRATVAHMASDHVGGFAVRKETGLNPMTGSAGEYRWGGAAGTAFWVDPKERMIVVWMTQGAPGPRRGEDRDLFRPLVQAAIAD